MTSEMQALTKNNTWIFTTLPLGRKAIGCKWVYKTKFHFDGTLERYKAGLVAQGFIQVQGIDFFDTYSPVIKLISVRIILVISSYLNFHLHQLDVHNAFFHGNLDREVYMFLPKGITPSYLYHVFKLLKSNYSLKESS